MIKQNLFKALAIIVCVIALDQMTKYLADSWISPDEPVSVLPFLRLVNVKNVGAAFGMLSGLGNWFFVVVAILAMGFISYLLVKSQEAYVAPSLILGGAVGNLIDRVVLGYVRDFVDVFVAGYHWPAFNVADSALTIGLFVLLIDSFRTQPRG